MTEAAKKAPPPKSARRRSREFALQGLYQWRVGGNDEAAIEAQLQDQDEFAKADREFCLRLVRGVLAQQEVLSAQISSHIDRPFADLSPIEACILLIGAFELVHHPETPYRVVINEAIELAKAFGGTDGHRYVNGVLDKLAAEIRPAEVEAKRQSR
ncbi:MAG: NusB antitermination factor [Rhodocyclaceae bacterium]|nr:NusB antitermination factor [Rhodocyclaceae bacterium]